MPKRDYAVRSKSKKSGKIVIISAILILLIGSAIGLWFLNASGSKDITKSNEVKANKTQIVLPSRPEETYSYIRDLETREVPIDKNSKYARLSKTQEQEILKQQELEKQKLNKLSVSESLNVVNVEQLEPDIVSKAKTAESNSVQEKVTKGQEQPKIEQKSTQAKVSSSDKSGAEKAKVSNAKYGLQCGAFKNKAQAENMQARLAMAGYNARISSNGDWNRVFVGPIGDRAAASAAQSNARSVAECLVIGM